MEALQRLHNRGSISTGYDIDNSLKVEADNSESLNFTPSSTGNTKVWTYSGWIKRTELGITNHTLIGYYQDGSNHTVIRFDGGDKLDIRNTITGTAFQLDTDMVFRDTSAWYHIVIVFDTTQSTAANRTKCYVNGSQVDLTGTYTSQNTITYLNTASKTEYIGMINSSEHFSGYMTEVNFVDGTALTPTSFGEYDDDSGIWKPKAYTGSYGTNGFYLDFSDSANLGDDVSGNSNNFTLNNISAADQATDTPTNNFCTFNTLQNNTTSGTNPTFTEGATVVNRSTGAGWMVYITTIPVNKGKWYAEFELERTNALQMQGTLPVEYAQTGASTTEYYLGAQANGDGGVGWYGSGSNVYHGGGYTSSTAADGGDIIGVAVDCDNNKVHFRVNATWTNSSNPASGNSGGFAINDELTYMVLCSQPANRTYKANFGGYTTIDTSGAYTGSDADGYGTFKFAPPSGYYALCTKNLEEYG